MMNLLLSPRSAARGVLAAALVGGALLVAAWPAAEAAPLTRAQVEQDYQLYRSSGLADLERDDAEVHIGTPAWQAARERYLALRRAAGLDPAAPAAAMPMVLTRAEVKADYVIYRESGLATLDEVEDDRALDTPQRDQARARYEALRQGDRFVMLVGAQRVQAVVVR